MAYTYDIGLAEDRDKIRALIRDVDSDAWILADEEIELYASLAGGSLFNQAAACADAAASELGRQLSVKDTLNSREQWEMMKSRAESLRARASSSAIPYAGGISLADKGIVEADTDTTPPAFGRDLFEDGSVDELRCRGI
jgi:hypothetical protein